MQEKADRGVVQSNGDRLERINLMAKSPDTSGELNVSVNLISEDKKRIATLRQQMRDTAKEIKRIESTTRRDADIAEWKAISDLKQKFIKELKSHPQFKRMSWKRFNDTPDYFVYAKHSGLYTHYSVDDSAEWVKEAVKGGTSLVELEANAKRMREARWNRARKAKRKAQKSFKDPFGRDSGENKPLPKKKKKLTDEERQGKGNLEEQLGNG